MTDDPDEALPTRASLRRREREESENAQAPALPAETSLTGSAGPPAAPLPSQPVPADDGQATQVFAWAPEPGAELPQTEFPQTELPQTEFPGTELPDTEPTPIDASLDGAPSADAQPPTEAMAWETAVVPQVAPGGPVPRNPAPPSRGAADPAPTGPSALDALFEPGRFRDFEPAPIVPRELPAGATAVLRAARNRPSMTAAQRSLLWAAGVLVAILVLIALFAIGRRLPAMFAAPAPVETSAPTSTPTPTPEPVDTTAGPVEPGDYAWDELRGGECIEPYVSAWEEDYTVVACDSRHAGQLLLRAQFPEEVAPDGVFPGFDELTAQINLLCTSPDVIDYGAAREYDDIVIEGSHAVSAQEWEEGHTEYFCFLTRSSGDPLDGTLALPREG